MDRCVSKEVSQLNAELREAIRYEAAQLGSKMVNSVQTNWTKFEKSECQLEESPYKGGSIEPLIYGVCERGLLVQRISEIEAVVKAAPN